jgi:hypothetical protein
VYLWIKFVTRLFVALCWQNTGGYWNEGNLRKKNYVGGV